MIYGDIVSMDDVPARTRAGRGSKGPNPLVMALKELAEGKAIRLTFDPSKEKPVNAASGTRAATFKDFVNRRQSTVGSNVDNIGYKPDFRQGTKDGVEYLYIVHPVAAATSL